MKIIYRGDSLLIGADQHSQPEQAMQDVRTRDDARIQNSSWQITMGKDQGQNIFQCTFYTV